MLYRIRSTFITGLAKCMLQGREGSIWLGQLDPKGRGRIDFCKYRYVVLQAASHRLTDTWRLMGCSEVFLWVCAWTCSISHDFAKWILGGCRLLAVLIQNPYLRAQSSWKVWGGGEVLWGNCCLSDQCDKQFGDLSSYCTSFGNIPFVFYVLLTG